MFPLQRKIVIAITIGGITIQVKMILTEVSRQVKAVFLIQLVTDIQVHIIKRSPAVFVLIR
jgi:hypothetical protein